MKKSQLRKIIRETIKELDVRDPRLLNPAAETYKGHCVMKAEPGETDGRFYGFTSLIKCGWKKGCNGDNECAESCYCLW